MHDLRYALLGRALKSCHMMTTCMPSAAPRDKDHVITVRLKWQPPVLPKAISVSL